MQCNIEINKDKSCESKLIIDGGIGRLEFKIYRMKYFLDLQNKLLFSLLSKLYICCIKYIVFFAFFIVVEIIKCLIKYIFIEL